MTLNEFENIIKRKTDPAKYFNYCICWTLILFALYLSIAGINNAKNESAKLSFILGTLLIISPNVYAIWVLKNRHKVNLWNNSLTKEQNTELLEWLSFQLNKKKPISGSAKDHISFIYKKYWLGLSYSIHLFADKNRIAVHADSTRYLSEGMVDLGASRRLENKIIAMMEKQSSTYLGSIS